MNKEITTIDDLKKYTEGDIVTLPPFFEGKPFVAKLKRPSLLALAKAGGIPNTLLPMANELFFGENNKRGVDALEKTFDVIEILCEAAFVQPTYEEIKASGIQLTDQQYLAVYNYSQQGIDSLFSFREEQANISFN